MSTRSSPPVNNRRFVDEAGNPIVPGQMLGEGGEGRVYRVDGQSNSVMKIWRPGKTPQDAEVKIRYLTGNPVKPDPRETWLITWPEHLVKENGVTVGYTMPMLDPSWEPIVKYYNLKAAEATEAEQGRELRIDDRVRMARNVVLSFRAVHQAGYVIGDVNEKNVEVNRQNDIALVDCDSYGFTDSATGRTFSNNMGRPEFQAPEAQGNFENRTQDQDLFGLGVIIFLLLTGYHPHTVTGKYAQDYNTHGVRISAWLFPPGNTNVTTTAEYRAAWNRLTIPQKRLFHQCFDQRYRGQPRPTPLEWLDALRELPQERPSDPQPQPQAQPQPQPRSQPRSRTQTGPQPQPSLSWLRPPVDPRTQRAENAEPISKPGLFARMSGKGNLGPREQLVAEINEIRKRHSVQPLVIGNNQAAQDLAEQNLRIGVRTMWSEDGFSVYARYHMTGGTQANDWYSYAFNSWGGATLKGTSAEVQKCLALLNDTNRQMLTNPDHRKADVGWAQNRTDLQMVILFEAGTIESWSNLSLSPNGDLSVVGQTTAHGAIVDPSTMWVTVAYDPAPSRLSPGQLLWGGNQAFMANYPVAVIWPPSAAGLSVRNRRHSWVMDRSINPFGVPYATPVPPDPFARHQEHGRAGEWFMQQRRPTEVSVPVIEPSRWPRGGRQLDIVANIGAVMRDKGAGVYSVWVCVPKGDQTRTLANYSFVFR